MSLDTGTRVILEAPISKVYHERTVRKELEQLMKKGYNRITQGDDTYYIEEVISESHGWLDTLVGESDDVYILIDRFPVSEEETNRMRIADSVLTAFQESEGNVRVQIHKEESRDFNNRFELDGIEFLEPSPQLFNFNNPFGACSTCEGYGRVLGIDRAKVIPDESKSVYDGAIACWNGEKSKSWLRQLIHSADQFDFPIHPTS